MADAEIVHGVCHGRASDGTRNEDLRELINEYPGKFTGFGGTNLTDVSGALEEASYCIDNLGLAGVMLEPGWRVPPLYPDDPKLYPCTSFVGIEASTFCLR